GWHARAPGPARGRRRVLRLVLLLMSTLDLLGLVALGAIHGINPAMGWLFAVALGLQERSARAVWRALPPLALGHAVAIAVMLALAIAIGAVIPSHVLRTVVA